MSVAVVVPWQGGCGHRERNLVHVLDWWTDHGFHVEIGNCRGDTWCKATAVADAVDHIDADVLIVADADVILGQPADLRTAITAVTAGVGWAVPHASVWRLDEPSTCRYLAGERDLGSFGLDDLDRSPYLGVRGGGIVVLARSTYEQVPLDARFVGWGQEDESWGIALSTLAGDPWTGSGPLWHLWHPHQERLSGRWGSVDSWRLHRRYRTANGDAEAMTRLIERGSAWTSPTS